MEVDVGWENGKVFVRKEGGGNKKVIGEMSGIREESEWKRMWEKSDVAMGLEDGRRTEGDGL